MATSGPSTNNLTVWYFLKRALNSAMSSSDVMM